MAVTLPIISWEALVSKAAIHPTTPYYYTVTVTPININDPGYGQVEVGYLIVDYVGHIFQIEEVNGYDLVVYDLIEDTQYTGPYNNEIGYVYESLQSAVLLAQAKLNRLDESAEDFVRSLNYKPRIVDSIQFTTAHTPNEPTPEGLVWWNPDDLTINVSTGVGPVLQVGQEIYFLIYNDLPTQIDNMTVLRPKAAIIHNDMVIPTVEKAIANIHSGVEGTIMVATMDIPTDSVGLATRFGRVRGGDTSDFNPGDGLYVSSTEAGKLVKIQPTFPDYDISVGGALNSDPLEGEIFVTITRSIFNTFNHAWDGSIRESVEFIITSDGNSITGNLSNLGDPTKDITLNFSDGFYTFDTTPTATVVLTAGSAIAPQTNYVYIDMVTKTLQASTSDWPITEEHVRIAQVAVFTATRTKEEGAIRNQIWNDHVKTIDNNGHMLHLAAKLRQFPAQWRTGTEGSVTIGANNEVYFNTTAGVVFQLHRQVWDLQNMIEYTIDTVNTGSKTFTITGDGDLSSIYIDDRIFQVHSSTGNNGLYTVASTSYADPNFVITVNEVIPSAVADGTIGDDIHIVNDFTLPYKTLTNINEQLLDASGDPLNNTSFSTVFWGIINKSGQESHLMVNFPTSTYNKNFPEKAVADADAVTVYDIPNTFQGVGFLIARVTFVDTSGVWEVHDIEDLRGKTPNTTAGGGGGGGGVSTWLGLEDTPVAFDTAFKIPQVNVALTALELTSDPQFTSVGIGVAPTDLFNVANAGDTTWSNIVKVYLDVANTAAFVVEQDGVMDDVLVVDTINGRVGVNTIPTASLDVLGDIKGNDFETGFADAFYFGDQTTNGTWRITIVNEDLNFERRESNLWIPKGGITA